MIARIDKKSKEIVLEYEQDIEAKQMSISYTKKIRNWQFRTKHAKGGWKGDVPFLRRHKRLAIGFWHHLQNLCKRTNIKLKFEGLNEFFYQVDRKFIFKFMLKLATICNLQLRPYQVDSVYKMFKFRFTRVDLSTAAGKTFVMFAYILILRYFKKTKQTLIIEPDSDYVIQTYGAFDKFIKLLGLNLKICMVTGDNSLKNIDEYHVAIGNFQTLINRGVPFYHKVDSILIDEGHRMVAKSISTIIKNCGDKVENVSALSGSYIEDDTADTFQLIECSGPIVKRVTKKQLMDAGYAPGIKIYILVLSYLTREQKREIAKLKETGVKTDIDLYDHEMSVLRNSEIRRRWIIGLMNRMEKNTLTFFSDVKNEYGKKLFNGLRNLTADKEAYYIDGDVKNKIRQTYKERMEEGTNKSLVASYDTYGTGKSINNLHNIICAEPKRSEIYINQAIGRGMRSMEEEEMKEHFNWYDVVDDFRFNGKITEHDPSKINFTNILYKQMQDRIKYYIKEGFEYEIRHIDLLKYVPEEKTPEFF